MTGPPIQVAPSLCPGCGGLLDGVAQQISDDGGRPEPGDLSVCASCGTMLVFDAELRQRAAQPADLVAASASDPAMFREYLAVVAWIRANPAPPAPPDGTA